MLIHNKKLDNYIILDKKGNNKKHEFNNEYKFIPKEKKSNDTVNFYSEIIKRIRNHQKHESITRKSNKINYKNILKLFRSLFSIKLSSSTLFTSF